MHLSNTASSPMKNNKYKEILLTQHNCPITDHAIFLCNVWTSWAFKQRVSRDVCNVLLDIRADC